MKHLIAYALAIALPTAASAADYVAPSKYATADAPNNAVLFMPGSSEHFEYQFAASFFGSAPITLNSLSFRYDSIVSSQSTSGQPFLFNSDFYLNIATAKNTRDKLSSTFTDNLGADVTTVLSGPQVIETQIGGASGERKSFGITFNFTKAFTYDPSKGDLIIEMNAPPTLSLYGTVDYTRSADDGVSGVFQNYDNGTTGVAIAGGPVTQFTTGSVVAAVPEPATWLTAIMGFGLIGIGLRGRRSSVAFRLRGA